MTNDIQSNEPADANIEIDEDDIDQLIEMESSQHAKKATKKSLDDKLLNERIMELGNQPKLKFKSDIFGYYESQKKQKKIDNLLFEAVMVILAAPATQVSVERAFSALALLMDDVRCKLSGTTVDNILRIALNSELTNEINFSDMKG